MATPLRVLLVEDSEDDALLLVRELQRLGYEPLWERVDSEAAFRERLVRGTWDVVLCDYVLPGFGGPAALNLAEALGIDVPIIVISGQVGEEYAVEVMRAGARDYVRKDNLARLGPAIQRELHEALERRAQREIEEILREREEFLRELVEDLDAVVWEGRFDPPRLTFINKRVESLLGYPVGRWLQEPDFWRRHVHPADRDRVLESWRQAVREGRDHALEYRLVRADGGVVWVHHVARVLAGQDGRPRQVRGIAIDVTARYRAEQALRESEQRFRAIVENSLELVAVLERDGTIRYASPSHRHACAFAPEELVGRNVFDFLHPDDRERVQAVFAEVLRAGQQGRRTEYRFRHRDGHWRFVEGLARDLTEDPVVRGVLVNSRDVTERKAAEEEALRMTVALEQRVRERTVHLEAANRELEAFAYSLSHDLRAPLRAVQGFAAALVEDCGARLDAQARHYADRIRAAAERMGVLMDGLLELSRISSGELCWEAVDLSSMAAAILEQLKAEDPNRRVETRVEPGLCARGDPRLLRLALENLLGNAWKYTAGRDCARIEFGCIRVAAGSRHGVEPRPVAPGGSGEGQLSYFVRDNGVGFDPAQADRLFRPFQRLHPAREFEGMGIGLATVRRAIHRHGGQVWAEAEPNRGATFYFTLGSGPAEG